MSPFKTIAAGILLLLVSAAGLVYIVARPKPVVRSLPAEPVLAEVEPTPAASPTPEVLPSPEIIVEHKPATAAPDIPRVRTFSVKLVSPSMADTFTAPATITLKAEANPNAGVKEVAFYSSPVGESVCQSLATYDSIPGTKLGEATSSPYEVTVSGLSEGAHNLTAVATYETGEQQISPSVVIIVNEARDFAGPNWNGWRPEYLTGQTAESDPALMPAPTPTPTLLSCPVIKVTTDYSPRARTNKVSFKASVEGGDPIIDASYHWSISAGEIEGEDDTSVITVNIDSVLDKNLVASVDVGRLHGICPNSASASVVFERPRWLDEKSMTRLSRLRSEFEHFLTFRTEADARGYIVARNDGGNCVDYEILKEARMAKRYLVEIAGLPSNRITIIAGTPPKTSEAGDTMSPDVELIVLEPGEQIPEWVSRASLKRGPVACYEPPAIASGVYKSPVNRKCPELDENIKYKTYLRSELKQINTCPDNRRDPANSKTQSLLHSYIKSGIYSNYPSFNYWLTGGRSLNNGKTSIWDLSEVKLRPGIYTAIARADDGCDCQGVAVTSINVTNFCTPCLTLECTPAETRESPGSQDFHAKAGNFALTGNATYNWTTTRGKIIRGQGTSDITVDTSALRPKESYVVTVSVAGLERYCVNKVSLESIVGESCVKSEAFEGIGGTNENSRSAHRRQPPTVGSAPGSEAVTSADPTPVNDPGTSRHIKENEWINISWTPDVKVDDAVEVKVVYNRTTEKLEVSNKAGEVSEELKLGKLLKEWFGKDYEVFGDVRLRAAGLQCDSCNQEQYQSFDKEKLEWSWPLKPAGKGTQIFSLELWVKGEPRDPQSGKQPKPSEKAWTKNSLKVDVREPVLTKTTVFAGGGLCAVLGFGLCVRGLKVYRIGDTYNVGQAVAVGRNVTMNNTTVNQPSSQTGENKDD